MSESGYEHIRNATNGRLAEMLETHNAWRCGLKPYDKAGAEMPFDAHELTLLLKEAAARLRIKPREQFNDEAFDI